jgi:hypothetical protein
MDFGHYATIRKISGEWLHCDDYDLGAISPLTPAEVRDHESACVFLMKKGDDPVSDRAAA